MAYKKQTFHTLEDLEAHKEELRSRIHASNETIEMLWHDIFVPKKETTKGEMVAGIINKSIVAFDAFMLARKLMKQYNNLFGKRRRR